MFTSNLSSILLAIKNILKLILVERQDYLNFRFLFS